MKLIIPMAGRGTRVRPHSHVTPKPLLPVRGKNLVARIVDTFREVLPRPLDEAVFVLGPDFGAEIRNELSALCQGRGIIPHFTVQEKAEGTAHAVFCAGPHLNGEGIVVYADTLFEMSDRVDTGDADVIMWVKSVDDPRRFGIAIREGDRVVRLEEKPRDPVSNEALIGIYYVRDLATLRDEIEQLIEQDVRGHGREFQLTDAFDRMLRADFVIRTATVDEWLDCGTIPAVMETTRFYLNKEKGDQVQGTIENCVLLEPVYVGPDAVAQNSVLGPNVSVERGARIVNSVLRETIVFGSAHVQDVVLDNSVIGHHAEVRWPAAKLNIGDHSAVGGT